MNSLTDRNNELSRIAEAYERRKHSIAFDRYSLSERWNLFRVQEMESKILSRLKEYGFVPLYDKQVLEIGCGAGFWLRELIQWGARPENLSGIDLLADRIAEARKLCPEAVNLQCGDASKLPYSDRSFDVILQSGVFTSIFDPIMKRELATEMLRVLRPKGCVLWYDFFISNPRNQDVRGIGKHEIRALFPQCNIVFQRLTLAPPLSRRVVPHSFLLYSLLSSTRILNTHYLACASKNE